MKTIRDLGEFGLIKKLCKDLPHTGDDCAVLPGGLLITCDPVIEGVHYVKTTPPRQVGWKAMGRNLSDIAAMAGAPKWAVVSLGLRPSTSVRYVQDLYAGMNAIAGKFGCRIVGGDTAHVRGEQFIVVTLLGHADRPVLRSGAKVGDIVFCSGKLGDSFRSGKHLTFTPRIREARWLVAHVRVHAMLDISDGLASDLYRLVESSHVGFDIDSAKIPGRLPGALTDGEDFELLFTVAPRDAGKLRKRFHEIGRVIKPPVVLLDGQPLQAQGYDHFPQRR